MADDRRRLMRAIHAKARDRGLDAEARHDLQERATGKASLTEMDAADMRRVLDAMDGRGRRRERRAERPRTGDLPSGPHTSKLRALWICAYELGVVRERDDAALAAWIRRQTGLDAARWATPRHTAQCVEALKDWLARDGGVDWRPYATDRGQRDRPRARVLEALWRKLHAAGAVETAAFGALQYWAMGRLGDATPYAERPGKAQDRLIRELGAWLRKVSA